MTLPHLSGGASPLDRIEAPLADLRFLLAGPRPAPEDVVVVAIDDATVASAGTYPLPRQVVAKLIRKLMAAQPRAIAIDILFLDASEPEADRELAEALASGPSVIAMAATFARAGPEQRASSGPFADLPVADRLSRPIAALAQATRLGLVNVATDHGGTPRHLPLLTAADGALQFSLSLVAARFGRDLAWERYFIRIGEVETPLDLGASLALRFYGPQGSIHTVSADAVVNGTFEDKIKDRIVVVGATAFGSGDTMPTPFDPLLPGVEVLATGIAHLVRGDALTRNTTIRQIDVAVAMILPLVVILLLSIDRIGLGIAGLLLAGAVCLNAVLFAYGLWFALALPFAAFAPPVALTFSSRIWLDRVLGLRLERARDALLRFHPPLIADRLAHDPDYLATPREQRAAVLFVDLSGFTGLGEQLGPARTQALLKEMHAGVEAVASAHDGSVTSFMGDGAMVLFGLPEPRPDDGHRALQAAIALSAALETWLTSRGLNIGLRIGAHAGQVVVSRLGGAHNQHITATGDTVNVASRLLEVAKTEGVRAVLSADLLSGLPASLNDVPLGPVIRIGIRGRKQGLDIRCLR
ncbi:hypothetical protein OCOJLMKI_3887 [Methylobacterium iners]|uniref:Guanylate cyclase domain-containing protein n=1 Tax=Methylobacterium iners TaxID=418707 RepID=A0ABQ4S2G1_9HYPH|nr:hypothetical protein OCOJLMKI_3887 [Methylobacterium iners]